MSMKKYPSKTKLFLHHLEPFIAALLFLYLSLGLFSYSFYIRNIYDNWDNGALQLYSGQCVEINKTVGKHTSYKFTLDDREMLQRRSSILGSAGFFERPVDYYIGRDMDFYFYDNKFLFVTRTLIVGIEENGEKLLDENVFKAEALANARLWPVFAVLSLLLSIFFFFYFFSYSIHRIFPNFKSKIRKTKKLIQKNHN